ncbi:hypothetical protein [Sphingobium sp. TCM1]|uniref:hypothetical protein n=1 Tax=Sphingobium sp. TCM1 TaxID=453246 RepID=UPI000B0F288A|nr:hypothetical protein [Sphingobium sp. TCM1]
MGKQNLLELRDVLHLAGHPSAPVDHHWDGRQGDLVNDVVRGTVSRVVEAHERHQ